MSGENGAYKELRDFQEERFTSLTEVLTEGFHSLETKLDTMINMMDVQMTALTKTLVDSSLGKGMVPLDIAREMLATQKENYSETIKDQQKIYKWYFRMLCWTFGVVLVAITGVRIALPQWFGG